MFFHAILFLEMSAAWEYIIQKDYICTHEWLQGAQYIGVVPYQRCNKVYLIDTALSLEVKELTQMLQNPTVLLK